MKKHRNAHKFKTEKALKIAVGVILAVGAIALVRHTGHVGNDFIVFWSAARGLMDGVFPYDVSVGPGMVFKYPPWILPIFLPYALFPLWLAKWLWGVTEVVSLASVLYWLLRRGCHWGVVTGVGILFWGIWAVHALDGQVTLPVLAISLWAVEGMKPSSEPGHRILAILWALSSKIFTVFALLGVNRQIRRWLHWKNAAIAVLFFGALSAPILWVTPQHDPRVLVSSWVGTAGSGGEALGEEKVRSRVNQGLPVMVLRLLDVEASRKSMDILAFLLVALILGGGWSLASSGLSFTDRWVGWLALTAAVHPLSWFHSFVLAFPLAATALDRAIVKKNRRALVFASLGILCTAILTSRVFGHAGLALEQYSIKSWGILLSLYALREAAYRRFSRLTN